jgi:predicted GH43/DUF377 family glycosyl hydrolase
MKNVTLFLVFTLICSILVLPSMIIEAFNPDIWLQDLNNPIEFFGTGIGPSCVYYNETDPEKTYHMWFTMDGGKTIGYTNSSNLIDWKPAITVLRPVESWEREALVAPTVVYNGSHFLMWYRGYEGHGKKQQYGLATSSRGIDWRKHPENPVLPTSDSGWDSYQIGGATVIQVDGIYHMWYHATEDGQSNSIGYANSIDGIEWKNRGDPLITPEINDENPNWDFGHDIGLGGSSVIHDGSVYHMWFDGRPESEVHWRIGYVTFEDPTQIDQENSIAVVWGEQSWETYGVARPSVVSNGIHLNMWFVGYGSNTQMGFASCLQNVDLNPPQTTPIILGVLGNENWFISDIEVQLVATDDISGVASTFFSLDGNGFVEGTQLTITTEGTHVLHFFSIDNAENIEETQTITLKIDKTPPLIEVNHPVYYSINAVGMELDFMATDTLSGVKTLVGYLTNTEDVTLKIEPSFVPEPGVYTLVVEAIDYAGNIAISDPIFFVVYDPDGGFATGGGWLITDNESTLPSGRANFGFVTKYKNDNSVGNLEFQYRDADINLKSTKIDWLAISTNKVIFQGVGTINGENLYTFRVKADDNGEPGVDVDFFSIKIWEGIDTEIDPIHKAKNTISGGNIKVHKR